MNYKMIRYITGMLMLVEGALMLIPLAVMLIYGEYAMLPSVLIPIALLAMIGIPLSIFKPKDKTLRPKDGFVIVGLSWLILSVFGCLPFVFSGLIPNFINAFFETVSGFTTTGSSVLTLDDFLKLWNPADTSFGMRGIFLWRSFTNWVGGMGVLVFVLAIMPQQDMKSSRLVHVMRAEMPGPKVDKIVATVKRTSAIMYGIYTAMTAILFVLLLFGGMDVYESACTAFATAGTGGFSIWSDSMVTFGGVAHPEYCAWVVAIFMLLFSVNFNVYFLLITGKALTALLSEELWWFIGIVLASTTLITVNIFESYNHIGTSIREAFFQVATIISTTGFSTVDFNAWPNMSKTILLVLMFIGACAGSTGGGIKISRIVIAGKSALTELKHMARPRRIQKIRFENKVVDNNTVTGIFAYLIAYAFIFFGSFLIIAICDGQTIETNFSAVAACINNIGPGLDAVGPMENFLSLSAISKIVLSFDMLLGRLEIFPILMLFSPSVWTEK